MGLKTFSFDSEWQNPSQMNHLITCTLRGIVLPRCGGLTACAIADDFYRLMGITGSRMSFGQLFVNDVYFGLYTLAEEMDSQWIEAQYAALCIERLSFHRRAFSYVHNSWEKHKGNYYDIDWGQWLGDPKQALQSVKQSEGDGNMTDYLSLVKLLNSCALAFPSQFVSCRDYCDLRTNYTTAAFASVFDVERYCRAAVIEVFSVYGDGYIISGNNYGLYHNPLTGLFDYTTRDYESTMMASPLGKGIYEDYHSLTGYNPILWKRLLQDASLRATYSDYFTRFLTRVFSVSGRAQLLDRIGELGSIVSHLLAHDYFYALEGGRNATVAQSWVDRTQDWVLQRATTCASALNLTLPPS